MTDNEKDARLKSARAFFAKSAQLDAHLERFLNGDEKERPIVQALHDDMHTYIQKVQLAVMRNGDAIGSAWNYEERLRLNKKDLDTINKINNIYLKLKANEIQINRQKERD